MAFYCDQKLSTECLEAWGHPAFPLEPGGQCLPCMELAATLTPPRFRYLGLRRRIATIISRARSRLFRR